jgi:hypothetical protein
MGLGNADLEGDEFVVVRLADLGDGNNNTDGIRNCWFWRCNLIILSWLYLLIREMINNNIGAIIGC